ncbi:unnamed protein product [Periconia digitata]|uniref:DNA endonuclease activator Ctp1 C-terminal domain-containing protein n=1 Tax=Periconia digitata TaxID=1303443 RepID=A0A9W4U8X4_9PLEO|nr:unnamed protein product [Periconia digitata]
MDGLAAWVDKNRDIWARVYDEVITPKIESEWKNRNEVQAKELMNKDEEHERNLALVNAEVTCLREENARLTELLQEQGTASISRIEQLDPTILGSTVSKTEIQRLTEKYNELNMRFRNSIQKVQYLERKNAAVMQKNKEMKESVKAWQEYCDRNTIKRRSKVVGNATGQHSDTSGTPDRMEDELKWASSPRCTTLTTPQSLLPQDHSTPGPIVSLASPPRLPSIQGLPRSEVESRIGCQEGGDVARERSQQASSPLPVDHGRILESGVGEIHDSFEEHFGSEKVTSSQTTEDEVIHTNQVAASEGGDNDAPEFLSERSLKRKRKHKPSKDIKVFTDRSDGTPAKPIHVKEEPRSSPPLLRATKSLLRKETMDLDEIGGKFVNTSDKSPSRTAHGRSLMNEVPQHQISNTSRFDGTTVKQESRPEMAETENKRCTGTVRLQMEVEHENLSEAPIHVLKPLNSNAILRTDKETSNKRMRRDGPKSKHNFLTESGETPPPMNDNERLSPRDARAHYNHKLHARKDFATPSKDIMTTPKTAPAKLLAVLPPEGLSPSTSARQLHTTQSTRVPQKKLLASKENLIDRPHAVPNGRPAWIMGTHSGPSRRVASPSIPQNSKPLRSKPMDELGVLDFKPNPAYNQGYTHAFSETVRKRSDRFCLPGCTSAECCGSTFRALARAAAPLDTSQEEDLLHEYLGEAYDTFGLTQMSEAERIELVLQARTRQMANEHGKHRQAFERGRSPPGFWRTGFPDTQEVEADKAKSREIEKGIVKERWLEAQRKGGKWVFRDE